MTVQDGLFKFLLYISTYQLQIIKPKALNQPIITL